MKTIQTYLPDKQAIAEFWDKYWEIDRLQAIIRGTKDDGRFVPLVKKYLAKQSVGLEGGCGRGACACD